MLLHSNWLVYEAWAEADFKWTVTSPGPAFLFRDWLLLLHACCVYRLYWSTQNFARWSCTGPVNTVTIDLNYDFTQCPKSNQGERNDVITLEKSSLKFILSLNGMRHSTTFSITRFPKRKGKIMWVVYQNSLSHPERNAKLSSDTLTEQHFDQDVFQKLGNCCDFSLTCLINCCNGCLFLFLQLLIYF